MRALNPLTVLLIGLSTYGQGTILFNNRTGPIDAPIGGPDGHGRYRGLGEYGGTAQLFLLSAGGGRTSLLPTTTFRDTSPGAAFYLNQATVTVPDIPAGSQVTVLVRAWIENSVLWGESNPVTVTLGGLPPGGGAPLPDALLIGLVGFSFPVPEPSTLALGAVGAVLLLARRRRP